MRADSGEVLKGCAPERFLNEFLACSLLSKPREAPEWTSGGGSAGSHRPQTSLRQHVAMLPHPFRAGMNAPRRLGAAQGEAAEVTF